MWDDIKGEKVEIPPDDVITQATPAKNGQIGPTMNGANGHVETASTEDQKEKEEEMKISASVGFFGLFRYATGFDSFLMILGTLAAIGMGCAIPVNLLVYGEVLDRFINSAIPQMPGNSSSIAPPVPLGESIDDLILYFVAIGGAVIVLGYVEIACWTLAAERQTRRIRALCYNSILKQHIGWFDVHETGELNTRLTDDINKIQTGIGDKFALCIQWVTTFLAGYVLGFIRGWQLTLVIISVAPVMVIAIALLQFLMQRITKLEQAAYAQAGAVAEEVLSSIRTVYAFGGEQKECARYEKNLFTAEQAGKRKGLMTGGSVGFVWVTIFGAFALAFWYGTDLVSKGQISGGAVLQVFFGVLMGTMSLGNLAPNLEFIANGRGAAAAVFELIEMESEIDSRSEEGTKPEITGNVEFKDVEFIYPARPELTILKGFNLKVNVGSTVALVGPSGCGKSTTVQLLQRFYDPIKGTVSIDGHEVRDMNVKWLRNHVGVVSQEPVLFAASIAENIRYGKEGVTEADIEQAAKDANAYDFIMKLPEKFETLVGERGSQLSGGQKQRVAIARALVRNPKILLLDEATSALDTESESIVQAALDQASRGRTTIVIAHRLSTIRNADVIVGIQDGCAVEKGSHGELMKLQGLYYGLVMSQSAAAKEDVLASENPMEEYEKVLQETEAPEKLQRTMSRSSSKFRGRSLSTTSGGSMRGSIRKRGLTRTMSMTSELSDSWSMKDEMDHAAKLPPAPVTRIMKMNSSQWPFIVFACVASVFTGAVQPTFAILFSEILGNFAETDPEKQRQQSSMFAGILFGIGIIVGAAQLCQAYFFSVAGESLTRKLRSMAFSSMLKQEVAWFDNRENQVGALTARLATDASQVRGAAGQQVGTMIQSITNIGTAIVIAFIFGWKLAFVVIAFLPAMIFAGVAQGMIMQGFGKKDQTAVEEGGKIAVETIDNIRTVAALTKEEYFYKKYDDHFEDMYRKGIKKSHVYGIFYSLGQSVIFFAYAAAFSYGADLIDAGEMEFDKVFRVFGALVFGGQALGRAFTFAPDLGKAQMSAAKLFALFDRKSAIDSSNPSGGRPESCGGNVTFQKVKFRYPTRPDVRVLQGLDLSVSTGKTLALVGASGCGKSTTVQLLERFYDPENGHVKLDGRDTMDLNIQWMRQQMGIVSQEPSLFDASIRDNIAYGDNSRDVPMDEIIAAARKANIHNFIESLPQGYDTNVGDRGTQLSGGQKQRIAIARALVRNPKVLLLDEATSALDTESEKVVQEALDQARVGRTSIVIAHRLSTIQNSDIIAVIHNGVVVEQGTHHELMAKEGYYYRLQKAQNRSREEDEYEKL